MDISTLNAHFDKLRRLAQSREALDGLKAADAGGGMFAAEIEDLTEQIEWEQAAVSKSEEPIAAWIAGIADGMTRTIFRLRFLRGCNGARSLGTSGRLVPKTASSPSPIDS